MQGTVFLHSGELQVTALDLDAGGRAGSCVVVRRVYRSRTIGDGPLGTWDASIFKHLRALPNGSVEFHDGAGEIWLFTPQSSSASYASPAGLFLRLASSERGWVLVDQKWRITEFDQLGRMTSEGDEFAKPGNFTAGNTIPYLYGPDGQLAQIIDPVGRVTTVSFYANDDSSPGAAPGHVREITDWRGRKVTYVYDDQYRLTEVRLPAVANATSGAGRPTIRYGYHPGAANFNVVVELGPNLVSITDPNEVATSGTPRVTFSYVLTGPNRDRIEKETWATGEIVSFTYVSPTQVDVKDALGQIRSNTIAGVGREARITALIERQVPTSTTPVGQLPASVTATAVPASQQDRTWLFEYDAMRLLRKRTRRRHADGARVRRMEPRDEDDDPQRHRVGGGERAHAGVHARRATGISIDEGRCGNDPHDGHRVGRRQSDNRHERLRPCDADELRCKRPCAVIRYRGAPHRTAARARRRSRPA